MRTFIAMFGGGGRLLGDAGAMRPLHRRQPVLAALAATLLSAVLLGSVTGPALAQPPTEDLPPVPGALERELGLPPPSNAGADALGGGSILSSPIEIPFILEGSHINRLKLEVAKFLNSVRAA